MRAILSLAAAAVAASAAPAGAQRSIEAPGPVAHRWADAAFPERVGDFRRSDVFQYDAEGRDVSASYNLVRPDGRMVITVYIYPAPRVAAAPGSGSTAAVARAALCGEQFAGVQAAIGQQYGDAAPVERGSPPDVAGSDAALRHRAVYRIRARFDGSEQEIRTEADLYCYVGGDWLVKYRASSHLGFDAAGAVESFIRTGPWPGRRAPASPAETAAAGPGERASS
jgi:hypothetical protein